MTGWQFTTIGPVPGTAPAPPGTWVLPSRSADARAYQSWGTIFGQPGTMPVPAPDAAAIPRHNLPTLGRGNIAGWARRKSGSVDAPQFWLPGLYFQRVLPNLPALGPDVSHVSDNQMPVPAIDPRGRPAVMAQRPPRIGGRGQVVQPYEVVDWPKFTQRNPLAPR